MTFLELVKRLSVEAGIGPGPTTVLGQTGEYARVIGWIQSAHEEIQGVHAGWNFLWTPIVLPAVPPIASPADLGEWSADGFRCYLTATGTDDEQFLVYVPWDQFRDAYLLGTGATVTGRPSIISIKPDDSLIVWPVPDDTYTVSGEYYSLPKIMTVDSSVPAFPQHHMAIVWKGLMLYARYSSEPDKYAIDQYKPLLRKLELSQLPKLMWGAPLV